MKLFNELKRRNVVKVASVYLVTAWLLLQIIAVVSPYLKIPLMFGTIVTLLLVLGFPIACVFAWAFELTPDGIKPTKDIEKQDSITRQTGQSINKLLASLLVIALGYIAVDYFYLEASPVAVANEEVLTVETDQPPVLALLPLASLSTEADHDIFVDGLTDELLNSLTKIRNLKVLGRSTTYSFKNVSKNLTEVGEQLNADYVIEGSVRRADEELRISIQLIETDTGTNIFSTTLNRKMQRIFTLQEEISKEIAAALKLTLVHNDTQYISSIDKMPYKDIEQLVIARGLVNTRAAEQMTRAKDILVLLMKEYGEIAEITGLSAYTFWMERSMTENREIPEREIVELAEHTLNLDSDNYDALITLAHIYSYNPNKLQESSKLYEKLISSYPSDSDNYLTYFLAMLDWYADCSTLKSFLTTYEQAITDLKILNQMRFVVLQCSDSQQAQTFAKSVNTDDVKYYSLDLIDRYYRALKQLDTYNNQSNILSNFAFKGLMGIREEAYQLFKQLNFEGNSEVTFISLAWANFLDFNVPAKTFMDAWLLFDSDEVFNWEIPTTLYLYSLADKEERLIELRELLLDLQPPELSIQNIEAGTRYIYALSKLGLKEQAFQFADSLLEKILKFKQQSPRAYRFYNTHINEVIIHLSLGDVSKGLSILHEYEDDDYALPLWGAYLEKSFDQHLQNPAFKNYVEESKAKRSKLIESLNLQMH